MSPDRIRPGSASSRPSEDREPDTATPPEQIESLDEATLEEQAPVVLEAAVPEIPRAEESAPAPSSPAVDVVSEALTAESVNGEASEIAAPPVREVSHGRFRRLYYGETTFDFVSRKRVWFIISTVVILAGVISLATRGLNLSIDFVGGTSWSVNSSTLSVQATNNALNAAGFGGATVVSLGEGSSRTIQVQAKLPSGQSSADQQAASDKVAGVLQELTHASSENAISIESVGPSWGGQITHKALIALIVFFILIAAYISIFFEWRMAVAAIIAVIHDILVTVGIYSLSGFLVTPDTVVAILTILGYSLYDTIVVFDRVRDNVKHLSVRDRLTFSDLVNVSMNQTLARSINTSLVAIMPIFAVLLLGAQVLGATTLQYFGLALLVGLTTGAYSSIFIASPLVALMKEREPRYMQLRQRIEARGPSRWILSPAEVARGLASDEPLSRMRPTSNGGGRVRPGGGTAGTDADSDGTEGTSRQPRPYSQPRTAPRRPASRTRRKGGRR